MTLRHIFAPRCPSAGAVRFARSLAASVGLHGLVAAGLLALVPARWVLGQGGGRVQRVALLDVQRTPRPWLADVAPEDIPLDLPADPLADPELVDVPWTRFVERFDVSDRSFDDPFGEPPTAHGDWTWSVPEPAVPLEPVDEPPAAEAPAPSEPLVADAEELGRHAFSEAEVVAQPQPTYPRLSIRRGEEGTVVCLLHVDAAGSVTRVEVLASSGFALLDESAVESLSAWRFRPALEGVQAVATTVRHEVVFRLED